MLRLAFPRTGFPMKSETVQMDHVLGAVLAGGASRRMGRDKALMEHEGRTLLARAVAVLRAVLDEVIIVGLQQQRSSVPGAPIVEDLRPGLGPVGGIHAALSGWLVISLCSGGRG